jgi:hydroxyisourate hydrolase
MRLENVNALDDESTVRELRRCCGSTQWIAAMTRARPFASAEAMADAGDTIWASLDAADWLEAFAAHPRIGDLQTGTSGAAEWEQQEQAVARSAPKELTDRLVARNRQYETRFGYIFILCATGKTVEEMLAIIEDRLQNDSREELRIAAEEQRQITRLRIGKLLEVDPQGYHMITTHVLDTARGEPAVGVTVILEIRQASAWAPVGRGTTDEDGRVSTLTDDRDLVPGTYRLTFDTGTYHRQQGISLPFFPEAKITFNVRDTDEHYHVPLLLSPFGYSTYRGT